MRIGQGIGRLVCVLGVLAIVLALSSQAASATPKIVRRKTLRPGVRYLKIRDEALPVSMYVLKFRPGTKATLDFLLSSNPISEYKTTSQMAIGAGAVAAVNGDLNDWPGHPTHQFVSDGTVMQVTRPGVSFAYRQNESGATVGHHPIRISATRQATGETTRVVRWNSGPPRTDTVVGFSWYGGKHEHPSTDQCSARLVSPTRIRWNEHKMGTGRNYTVGAVRCSSSQAMSVDSAKTVVLSSKLVGDGATFIKSLTVGSTVHLGWNNFSPGAVDIVSGNAMILSGGMIQWGASCTADKCSRNPRTAVGITKKGSVIFLAVDGRSSKSIGYTLYQLGKEMKVLGAVDAVNLDGGGSTTMWIKGLGVVNHPTDPTGERPVSNAIAILPGADSNALVPLKPLP
jgi:hypothetical protein